MAQNGGRWGLLVVLGAVALAFTAAPAFAAGSGVSAGYAHTCALKSDGTPVCWGGGGGNSAGQTTVPDGTGTLSQVGAGGYHSCGVKASDGAVACWGRNAEGQATVPAGTDSVAELSTGFAHTCVVKTDGTPVCWGLDDDHQTDVPAGIGTVIEIAAGGFHTCAIKSDGTPICWGWDDFGQSTVPSDIGTVAQLTAGLRHTCAVKADGTVACWGDDSGLQIDVPPDLGVVTAVSAGAFHTCAIKTGGTPVCWGQDDKHQTDVPSGIGAVTQISAGFEHTCAVRTGGGVVCWGDDASGQVGTPPAITSAGPPNASAEPYTHSYGLIGSLDPSLSVTSGALPPGLTLSHGQISGTPTMSGHYAGAVTASDGVFADATQPFSIDVDVDAPVTTDNVPAGPVNHAVTVTLGRTDKGWGGVAHTYYTTDGSTPTTASAVYDAAHKPVLQNGQRIRYLSVDGAGNVEAVKTSAAALVDTKAPTVSITSPANGAAYVTGARVLAAYACSDACSGTVPRGAAIDTLAAGRHTFTVTARDAAGNVTRRTVAYTVKEPLDVTGPVVTIAPRNKTLKMRSKAVVFRLGAALEPTTGTIALTAKRLKAGSASFAAATGHAAAVKIKLSSKARKALKKSKKLKATALVTVRDAAGNATVETFKLTIKR